MARQFRLEPCPCCGEQVSVGGASRTAHMRMHVRNDEMVEFKTKRGLEFLTNKQIRELPPYAVFPEEPKAGQPKGIWELRLNLPAVDPAAYFTSSGEAAQKADKLVSDLFSVCMSARYLRDCLRRIRGKHDFLQCTWDNGRLVLRCIDRRRKIEVGMEVPDGSSERGADNGNQV